MIQLTLKMGEKLFGEERPKKIRNGLEDNNNNNFINVS